MPPLEVTSPLVAQATLADYTAPGLIVPRLGASDTPGIIAELSHALQRGGFVPDVLPLYHTALNQEILSSSALECGIAFPHARLSGVKRLCFALGCTDRPIIWGPKNALSARVIFLLAVPATDAAPYLHLLATIARLGQQPEKVYRLHQSGSAEAALGVLQGISVRS
jgi:mannitol/fructose-specific phosphotransferase system IIA component (Ntr-type)